MVKENPCRGANLKVSFLARWINFSHLFFEYVYNGDHCDEETYRYDYNRRWKQRRKWSREIPVLKKLEIRKLLFLARWFVLRGTNLTSIVFGKAEHAAARWTNCSTWIDICMVRVLKKIRYRSWSSMVSIFVRCVYSWLWKSWRLQRGWYRLVQDMSWLPFRWSIVQVGCCPLTRWQLILLWSHVVHLFWSIYDGHWVH